MLHIEQIRPEHTWKLRRDVLYPNETISQMAMEEDNYGYHFAVFKDNYIVAVVSLFQHAGADWQFRKFAVSDQVQKEGIGTQLLIYITDFVVQEHGIRLWCNAGYPLPAFTLNLALPPPATCSARMGLSILLWKRRCR